MCSFDMEAAIVLGGWDSRYARVLDVVVDGGHAAALVDTNGDGGDVNVDLYSWQDGQWVALVSGNGSVGNDEVFAEWIADDRLRLVQRSR